MFHKEKECRYCIFAKYHDGGSVLASGFICKLNPFKPVVMGLTGICKYRKENLKEQYQKKDS